MALYYDERAAEYDEIYSGRGPAFPHPELYREDANRIAEIVSRFGTGALIDIACGTGFWLLHYADNCTQITLLDQSKKMLEKSKERALKSGINEKCKFIHSDFFQSGFETHSFDSALVGFLISHLTNEKIETFFVRLNEILKPRAELLIIDSAWTVLRQKYRQKEEMQKRSLNDGREFNVFKRYMDSKEFGEMLERYEYENVETYCGYAFLAVISKKK